jgi:DNA-binding XRE family transcriptional regulator
MGGEKMTAERLEMFWDHLTEQLQDPEFRDAYEPLEPGYQIARLRILRGLTQEELAEKVGTKQPSIARLESGKTEPKISFLRRLAEALGADLEIRIVPQES